MSIDYRPDNTIVFTIGRMNPPTPGHLFIIQKLIEQGIQKNVEKVFIILSKTNDNNENPIPCPEKQSMLGHYDDASRTMINSLKKEMIDNTEDEGIKERIYKMIVDIICVPEDKGATPFTSLINIVKSKSEIPDLNLFLIIGGDRENMLDSVTDVMFKKYPNVNSVDGIVLHRKSMDKYKKMSPESLADIDISEVRENNGFSGTLIRKLVKNDFYDKFKEVYSPYLDEEKILELYNAIKIGLDLPSPPQKKEPPLKQLKYTYPMIKEPNAMSVTKRDEDISSSQTISGTKRYEDISSSQAISSKRDEELVSNQDISGTKRKEREEENFGGKKTRKTKLKKYKKSRKSKKHNRKSKKHNRKSKKYNRKSKKYNRKSKK